MANSANIESDYDCCVGLGPAHNHDSPEDVARLIERAWVSVAHNCLLGEARSMEAPDLKMRALHARILLLELAVSTVPSRELVSCGSD